MTDSTLQGGDSSLDPPSSGQAATVGVRKDPRCSCLFLPSGGLLPQPPMADFPSRHEPYGKARSALFPAEVVSCVPQLDPGGSGELTSSQAFLSC